MKTIETFFRPPLLATTGTRSNLSADRGSDPLALEVNMKYLKSEDRIPKPNRSTQPTCAPRLAPAMTRRTMGARRSTICLQVGHAVLFLALALSLDAQTNYTIDWHTIDGGGGMSTGGVYSVSGTIGQPDAGGPMTHDQYSVTGGFWALPTAIQTPGAPTLTITPATPGNATVSWFPNTGTNWVLQETAILSPADWTNSPTGFTNPIVVSATLPKRFYRLFKP